MQNGVPPDLAFSLPPDMAAAWQVIYGELNGGTFSTDTMSWVDPK